MVLALKVTLMMTIECIAYLFRLIFKEDNTGIENRLKRFNEWMEGQTVSTVNDETFYYLGDVQRFMAHKSIID